MGCGDVGQRVARLLRGRVRLMALTSSVQRVPLLRELGIAPLLGNLDASTTLRRLAGIATRVVHLAPPPSLGSGDPRTRSLVCALVRRSKPVSLVYGSTSGVYGDCQGDWVGETRHLRPDTARAQRRVDAEQSVRFFGRSTSTHTRILRIPGIYAPDREGGTPRTRLLKGTPVLRAQDDVYTNHIHADDLARACLVAVWRGGSQRVYNINDDTCLKMGDYFDLAADLYQLPRPPRVSREAAVAQLPAVLLSFMSESRRMLNQRMKSELGLRLRYLTVAQGLA